MESMNTGATKSSILLSVPCAKSSSSSPSSEVYFHKRKRWSFVKIQLANPMTCHEVQLSARHSVGFCFRCRKGSEFRDPEFEPSTSSHLKSFQDKFDVFNRFIWSEIIIFKVWSIISASLLAVEKLSDISPFFIAVLSQASVAVALLNIYIIGLNQITDIEIDKVNKPHRPLVTGEYSIKTAVIIVSSSLIMSFLVGWMVGSWPLLCSLFIAFALGTIYSVNIPFLRWKRNSFAAAFIMLFGHVVFPLGNYFNIQIFVLGRPALCSKAMISMTAFLSIMTVAQSQFKDIPDIEGDKLNGIHTLAFRFGAKKVFWICVGLIEFAYFIVVLVALTSSKNWSKLIIVNSHMFLASVIWIRAKSVNLGNNAAIQSFYVFMRTLVSTEFFLVHFMR